MTKANDSKLFQAVMQLIYNTSKMLFLESSPLPLPKPNPDECGLQVSLRDSQNNVDKN